MGVIQMPISTRTVATLTDDLTAKVTDLPDASQAAEIKLAINGKTCTLATTKEIADALTAFVTKPSDETLRAVGDLGVFPRTPIARSSGNSGEMKAAQWAREHPDGQAWSKAHPDIPIGNARPKQALADAFATWKESQPASA
jgi:hypothetical protein